MLLTFQKRISPSPPPEMKFRFESERDGGMSSQDIPAANEE